MTEHQNTSDVPDGAFAWIQRDEQDAIRVPAFREGGRWVLGYYADGTPHTWDDADIAHVQPITTEGTPPA